MLPTNTGYFDFFHPRRRHIQMLVHLDSELLLSLLFVDASTRPGLSGKQVFPQLWPGQVPVDGSAPVATELHVHPVILIVPNALYSQI